MSDTQKKETKNLNDVPLGRLMRSKPVEFKYRKVASSKTSRLEARAGFFRLLMKGIFDPYVKYRGPILRVTSQALGSDDSNLDQSATSIQILPEPSGVT